ncbi:MAG: hypothetical protein HC769_24085 [Cyanobacteria bacterium CRU_2_1]|nr:hypothetical protein [Cyanobacteria bacterium RU_5_0]NJR61640.1 hypothetical protein [Cyanobacteria bacterium CRU_2_1]
MTHNRSGSQVSKIVYFRVKLNSGMELVPMEVNADGLLKYRGKYVDEYHQEVDSESSMSQACEDSI